MMSDNSNYIFVLMGKFYQEIFNFNFLGQKYFKMKELETQMWSQMFVFFSIRSSLAKRKNHFDFKTPNVT